MEFTYNKYNRSKRTLRKNKNKDLMGQNKEHFERKPWQDSKPITNDEMKKVFKNGGGA